MRHIVYVTTNNLNGKFYIGVYDKNRNVNNYLGSGTFLKRAIKKHGIENFERQTLKEFEDENDAYEYEKTLITECLINDTNCYNINVGGHGGKYKHSDKTKKILSNKAKKRIGNKNPFFGKKHKKETIEKISKSKRNISDETRLKMSISAKNRYKRTGGIKNSTNYFGEEESESFKRK